MMPKVNLLTNHFVRAAVGPGLRSLARLVTAGLMPRPEERDLRAAVRLLFDARRVRVHRGALWSVAGATAMER